MEAVRFSSQPVTSEHKNLAVLESVNQSIKLLSKNLLAPSYPKSTLSNREITPTNLVQNLIKIESVLSQFENSIENLETDMKDFSLLKAKLTEIKAYFVQCKEFMSKDDFFSSQLHELEMIDDRIILTESKLRSEVLLKDTFQNFSVLRFNIQGLMAKINQASRETFAKGPSPQATLIIEQYLLPEMQTRLLSLYKSAHSQASLMNSEIDYRINERGLATLSFDFKVDNPPSSGTAKMIVLDILNDSLGKTDARFEIHLKGGKLMQPGDITPLQPIHQPGPAPQNGPTISALDKKLQKLSEVLPKAIQAEVQLHIVSARDKSASMQTNEPPIHDNAFRIELGELITSITNDLDTINGVGIEQPERSLIDRVSDSFQNVQKSLTASKRELISSHTSEETLSAVFNSKNQSLLFIKDLIDQLPSAKNSNMQRFSFRGHIPENEASLRKKQSTNQNLMTFEVNNKTYTVSAEFEGDLQRGIYFNGSRASFTSDPLKKRERINEIIQTLQRNGVEPRVIEKIFYSSSQRSSSDLATKVNAYAHEKYPGEDMLKVKFTPRFDITSKANEPPEVKITLDYTILIVDPRKVLESGQAGMTLTDIMNEDLNKEDVHCYIKHQL